jgi:phospholipase/carboxylesterase
MPKLLYQHVHEPGTDPEAPPLLLLHGTGGSEHDLLRLGRMISPGSALLSPRGTVNEEGAMRFFGRLAEGVFDPQEVSRRTQSLGDFIVAVAAAKAYSIDLGRLVAIGFSNGANIAGALLLLRPEVLAAAAMFRPMVVLDLPASPGSLVGKRVLITNGTTDPLVPADHPARLAELFRVGGAEVVTRMHLASHALVSSDLDAAREWIQPERARVTTGNGRAESHGVGFFSACFCSWSARKFPRSQAVTNPSVTVFNSSQRRRMFLASSFVMTLSAEDVAIVASMSANSCTMSFVSGINCCPG